MNRNHGRSSRLASSCLLVLGVLGCQHSVAGLEQDTHEASESALENAADAKQRLDREVGAFQTQAGAKLQELSVSINSLKAKTQSDLDGSRQKLEAQLNDTRQQLTQLQADSATQWRKAKQDLEQRIAELGRQLNQTLDKAGGSLDRAGDQVERALQPNEPQPKDEPK